MLWCRVDSDYDFSETLNKKRDVEEEKKNEDEEKKANESSGEEDSCSDDSSMSYTWYLYITVK